MTATDALTDDECRRLISELPDHWRPLARFLLHSGLRVNEALTLRRGDVDPDAAHVTIRAAVSKTGRGRRVPLNETARQAIRPILARPSPVGAPLLWTRVTLRFSIRAFQGSIARASARAGVPGRVSPHTLRHSFASRLAAAGVRLDVIQHLLGHARLSSTQRYLHARPEDLASAVAAIADY